MKKNKRKIETSKILLIVSDVMAAAVLIGTVVAVFVLQDATPLAYLIPAVFVDDSFVGFVNSLRKIHYKLLQEGKL